MTYEEYKKQRLSENTKKADTSNVINTNGSYAEYKKQRLSGNTTSTKITQPANMPSYQEHLKALEEKKQHNTENFISSLPVSATAVKTQMQNDGNRFKTGINPDSKNTKSEMQKKVYEQIINSDITKNIKEYANAQKYYDSITPESKEDNYLNYKILAEQTDNPVEKAKYNVMAEKSKKHTDLYYNTAQTMKTLGTSIVDSAVNAVQFVKNAWKSEMQREIRDAWNSIATFTSPDYKSRFKGLRNVSDEQANKIAQNSINSAIQILKKYNITVPDNVTPEYARKMIEDIDSWTYKENKIEEFTRKAHENVQEQNQQLGNIGKTITQTTDVVGNMIPTISTNAVLPGAGMGTMFLSSAQGSTEEALREGATYEQALSRGILSGGLEVATEMIGGENIAKLTGMPTLFKKLGIDTSNKLMQVVLDVGSEGLEEMVSAGVQPVIDRATYNPNAKFATAEDYWNSFKESILPTLVFAGVNSGVNAVNNHKIKNAVNNYKTKAIEKVEQSNMTVEQKAKAKIEIEKGAQKVIDEAMGKLESNSLNDENSMKLSSNLQKNVENGQNNIQNQTNNVQNISNLESNQQMSISDAQNTQATLPSEIQNFVENRNKVANGLNVQLDNTLNTDGVMIKNQDGTRTIKINPRSTRAYEFVAMHEMLHDLSGTQEYQELANFVKERAMTHDTFEKAKQTITDKYAKYYQENGLDMSNLNMDVETVNDMTAQALGNQEFLNELAGKKPNVFMRMYNWVKNVLFDGQKTGKTFSERRADNKYLNELKKKFETAYNTAYRGNSETKYSIQTDNNGNKYVKVDTDQNIFEGVETKDYPKIARIYMQDYLKGNTALGNNSTANIGNKGINKYTNPIQQTQYKNEKMKLSTELNNILAVSEKVSEGLPTKDTSKFPNWEYYKVNFEIDGKTFEGLINIGVDKNGNKHFYDINKIRITSNSHISASKSSNTDFINYSIPPTDSTVNNQYMQNNGNNTQGLENSSSFSLPKNNLKIDEIADILNIYEQYKYEDKTPITESIDELEQKISETTDWDTRYDLNAKLKALKNEYNSVYDYLIGREKQRIAENLNYNEHYYDKQLNEKTQKIERQKKLEKEIKEATPFKRAQYEIIQETNPMFDDEHVGIRSPADIKTFEEVIDDEESFQWGDYTKEDALKDLKRNKVRVYSSYPIKNGVFVSTSYEQALEYAGNDRSKVHSKEVAPNRVAWINGDEGQYASVTNERLNKAKSLDNTTSTTNSDIRYSQSDKSWSKYLKEYWDLMPNSTKTFGLPTAEELQKFDNEQGEKTYKSLHKLEDIADMTEDDIRNEKGVNYKHKKDKDTQYERKFFKNAKTSEIINDDIKDSIDVTTYERQSNAETLEKAKNKLDEKGDKLIKQWESKTKNFTAEDVAIGAILIERYQQQGDNESAVNVVQKLADMGTEVGRAVQMYSIFQRLTPEAMMIYQQRKLNDVFKEISQRKTGEWVEANKDKFKLTAEDNKFITEQVEKAQQATSEREKQIELAKIEKRINDKLPPERGQTIKAIRRMAMLFNPKTQVRNVVGNALIMPVNDVADAIGTQIDKLIAKKTGVRTTNYANFKEKGKGIKKGITEAVQDYKMGIRTEPSGSKYEFNFGGKSFNENTKSKTLNAINNKLNGIENLLGAVMSGGDRPFYEAAFNNSLQGQMKANNVTTPTTEMIDIAVNEALSRTWNDSNAYTKAVLYVRNGLNSLSNAILHTNGIGLGDLIIPFAKTPANLAKAIIEYSPVGTIEAIYDYVDMKKAISRGEMTAMQQKKFVNSMSKAIAGSILYLIAGTLAHTGAITGSADDDEDVRNFEQNVLGIQPYSIKIGDKTFTYSWASPLNAPLAIMADTYKMSKNNEKWFDILTNAFKVAGETFVENSFLQGVKSLFEDGLIESILDLPSQFVPTLFSQFATLFDKNKRQTFEYGDKLKTTVNQMKTKIPGLKNTLAPTVNTFGEEVENYGGDNNIFNVFLNPANISKANATDTQKELYALYEATKDKTIFPRQAPYYLNDDGEKINLSSEERTKYQKASGRYVTENLGALFDSEFYKSLENEDKIGVINKIISDANTIAKDKWIDNKTTEEVSRRNKELDEAGIPLIDYYNAWFAKKEAEGKKNAKGETISGTNKKAQKTAINEAVSDDITPQQKKSLYKILGVD